MKHIVGVADMLVSGDPADEIVTHALGSCLGISVYDATAQVGGLLHVMLPMSTIDPEKAKRAPWMFIDTGVPRFFREIYAGGGEKRRLIIKVAGGANVHKATNDRFAIGKRNFIVFKKLLWKNGLLIESQEVGGSVPRTMRLEIGSGRVSLSTAGNVTEL